MDFSCKQYINLVKEFSLIEFKAKDQRSVLGFFWSFLNPIITATILYFLFRNKLPAVSDCNYFLYILIGAVCWNFCATATLAGLFAIVEKAEMAKNVAFPKEILVYSKIGTFFYTTFV